nr:ribonuclease H-like domain-containing protein [Tanacetum cinerariifolium]
MGPVTTKEKIQKKNDVKARSMLLMALPNEHLLTFNQYKDAKTLFAAIQTRFGGNEATKKTQKTLLKQMYESFSSPSTLSIDTIFNKLQKLNKPNLDTMCFDDLYNNFKIVEQEVSTSSTQVSTANLSDATVYAFLASRPNGSQLVHEDLVQIYKDDLEEMDLKWWLTLLSMRTKRFFQKTGRKITINRSDTTGYEKNKVECFNCHKLGYFARKCRQHRIQDGRNWNQDSSRRPVNVEDFSSKAMLVINGAGFDWSYMADDEVSTNMALMAFLDYELDLSNSSLEEFQQPEFESYGPKTSKNASEDIANELKESSNAPLVKDRVSDNKDCLVESPIVIEKKTVVPTIAKVEVVRPKQQEKPVRKPVKERVVTRNNYTRVHYNYSTKKAHPSPHRNMTPRAVLMKIGLRPLNTARLVNTTHPKITVHSARPMSCFCKLAPSTVKRPIQKKTALTNRNFHQQVNTANGKVNSVRPQAVNTARPKTINTARPSPTVVNDVRAKQVNADHPQKVQEDQGYVDSRCSRHMTRNMSYLFDFKEFDRGYVTFGRGANGGRITGKGTIHTGNLDFEVVYFVKELKFNLFSVSQMCDKKNNVLFVDTECIVLSPDIKLPDESQIILRVSKRNNIYSIDKKNIVPKESLTCLVAKATLDESMLWHRRLGHINFKNINKLVKDNLVRGLPLKCFENDQTCDACLKGKQHKASCKTKI